MEQRIAATSPPQIPLQQELGGAAVHRSIRQVVKEVCRQAGVPKDASEYTIGVLGNRPCYAQPSGASMLAWQSVLYMMDVPCKLWQLPQSCMPTCEGSREAFVTVP